MKNKAYRMHVHKHQAYSCLDVEQNKGLSADHPTPVIRTTTCGWSSILFLLLLLLLFQSPLHRSSNSLIQGHKRLVSQPPFGLGDIVVARHAAENDALSVECGRLSDQPEEPFAEVAKHQPDALGKHLYVLCTVGRASSSPDGAAEVPEVDRAVVGDEKDLAINSFVIERNNVRRSRGQEGTCSQQVTMRNVLDVGKIEQVVVVADLNVGPSLTVDIDHVVQRHHVAFTHDTRWPDRACQQLGGFCRTVGSEDYLLSSRLEARSQSVSIGRSQHR